MQSIAEPYVPADYARARFGFVAAPTATIAEKLPLQAEPHAIFDRAQEQHAIFVKRLGELGVIAKMFSEGAPPLTAAVADLAVVTAKGAVLMRPEDSSRWPEVATAEACLRDLGIPILGKIEAPGLLDAGDILLGGDTAYIGAPRGNGAFVRRNNEAGRQQFAQMTGLRVVAVPIDAHIPRLRSVAALLDDECVLLGTAVVDAAPFDGLRKIMLPRGEEYAAGVLVLGERRVVANLRFREAPAIMRKERIALVSLDLWEFGKLGITPASLLLVAQRG